MVDLKSKFKPSGVGVDFFNDYNLTLGYIRLTKLLWLIFSSDFYVVMEEPQHNDDQQSQDA